VSSILNITLPIFLLIGLGYALVRSGMFTSDQFRALGRIVINVALPAVIIRALSTGSISEVLNTQYLAAYCGASLAVLAAGLTIGVAVRRRSLTVAAIRSLGMSSSNSAFIGFPVAYQVLGAPAVVGLALNIIIENVIVIPTALALAEMGRGERNGAVRVIGRTVLNLIKTPILIAVAFGMLLAVTGFDLPVPVARTIDVLANMAAAASLLAIGGALVGLQTQGLATTISIIGFGKLILHPLAVLGAITLIQMDNQDLRAAALIYAACPMLSVFPLLGARYGEEGACAAALLVTTLASFFTLSAWIWLISHGVIG
jgi:malonate transporter and related proteins